MNDQTRMLFLLAEQVLRLSEYVTQTYQPRLKELQERLETGEREIRELLFEGRFSDGE